MGDQLAIDALQTELDRRKLETDAHERGDDPTPRELVRAIIEVVGPVLLAMLGAAGLRRVLDVCAGYGCWASEWRRWWVRNVPGERIEITGVEIHSARREHLSKWCDVVNVDDWRPGEYGPDDIPFGYQWTGDIAIGNPYFELLLADDGDPEQSMPAVLLRHAHAVLLYHTRNAFLRNEPGRAVWRSHPPARVFMVPGTVSHDGTSAVASDCYQVSLWLRNYSGPTIEQLVDVEPKEANAAAGILKRNGQPYSCWRWTVPPGSEEPSEDLPAAPGWRP